MFIYSQLTFIPTWWGGERKRENLDCISSLEHIGAALLYVEAFKE